MSLTSLHSIELQLIARLLPVRCILAFARCSRFTLDALDSPFTFSQCDPLVLHTRSVVQGDFNQSRPLTRHLLVSLVWEGPTRMRRCIEADVAALLSLASKHAGVIGLDAKEWLRQVDLECWIKILSAPCMQQLRSLEVSMLIDDLCLPALASLPQLHSLSFVADWSLPLLNELPSLTSLKISVGSTITGNSLLQALSPLPRLHKLHLGRLVLDKHTWLPLWTALSGLKEVQLELLHRSESAPITAKDFEESFRALNKMHSLTLTNVWNPDSLLAQLHHASSLRRVNFITSCGTVTEHVTLRFPAVEVLRHLMQSLPVTVCMDLRTGRTEAEHNFALLRQSRYSARQAVMGNRLEVQVTVD